MQDEILKFYELSKAKVCDETTQLFINLAPQIRAWLSSDEFRQNYSHLTYAPLLNPKNINYETSEPELCFILNIPLPPFYDFMMFGSHGTGFAAIPKLLKLCACGDASRDGEQESFRIYESLFEQLLKQNELKKQGKIKAISLNICDFALDEDNEKLYSLMPAKCALHIVRDPISILKALCNLQTPQEHCDEEADFTSLDQNDKMVQKIKRIGKKTLAYTLDVDPCEILKDKVLYRINTQNSRGGGHFKYPNASACEFWAREITQGFHDGLLAKALVRVENIRIMQTDDFMGKKAFSTLEALSAEFGFNKPDDSLLELFQARVSDLKCFIPAYILLNQNNLQKDNKVQMLGFDEILSVKLSTKFECELDEIVVDGFALLSPFVLVANSINDIKKLHHASIKAPLQEYLTKLTKAILDQVKTEDAKKITQEDILEYFKQNKQSAMLFDGLLTQHLRPLSKNNDLINSWGYYKKFEKIISTHYENDDTRFRLCRKNDDKSYVFMKFKKDDLKGL